MNKFCLGGGSSNFILIFLEWMNPNSMRIERPSAKVAGE
jgi:hypothetical protein